MEADKRILTRWMELMHEARAWLAVNPLELESSAN
jgi:hypothetical protein